MKKPNPYERSFSSGIQGMAIDPAALRKNLPVVKFEEQNENRVGENRKTRGEGIVLRR